MSRAKAIIVAAFALLTGALLPSAVTAQVEAINVRVAAPDRKSTRLNSSHIL